MYENIKISNIDPIFPIKNWILFWQHMETKNNSENMWYTPGAYKTTEEESFNVLMES